MDFFGTRKGKKMKQRINRRKEKRCKKWKRWNIRKSEVEKEGRVIKEIWKLLNEWKCDNMDETLIMDDIEN